MPDRCFPWASTFNSTSTTSTRTIPGKNTTGRTTTWVWPFICISRGKTALDLRRISGVPSQKPFMSAPLGVPHVRERDRRHSQGKCITSYEIKGATEMALTRKLTPTKALAAVAINLILLATYACQGQSPSVAQNTDSLESGGRNLGASLYAAAHEAAALGTARSRGHKCAS
jgi:hypothetical protein